MKFKLLITISLIVIVLGCNQDNKDNIDTNSYAPFLRIVKSESNKSLQKTLKVEEDAIFSKSAELKSFIDSCDLVISMLSSFNYSIEYLNHKTENLLHYNADLLMENSNLFDSISVFETRSELYLYVELVKLRVINNYLRKNQREMPSFRVIKSDLQLLNEANNLYTYEIELQAIPQKIYTVIESDTQLIHNDSLLIHSNKPLDTFYCNLYDANKNSFWLRVY